jgi:hypothetical protein
MIYKIRVYVNILVHTKVFFVLKSFFKYFLTIIIVILHITSTRIQDCMAHF